MMPFEEQCEKAIPNGIVRKDVYHATHRGLQLHNFKRGKVRAEWNTQGWTFSVSSLGNIHAAFDIKGAREKISAKLQNRRQAIDSTLSALHVPPPRKAVYGNLEMEW